jgi:RNA polymerase sigma-70 factor, ECF subfamily
MHPTDEELISAYVERRDERAFQSLVERHQERIFGYLLGMVRDYDVANDLFQETFFKIIAALQKERGGYDGQGRFLQWAMRIARNGALDFLRSRKKWVDPISREGDESGFWDALPDESPALDDRLHVRQQWDRLAMCIERLSPEQREVVLLRHEAEMTFKEIAELTGVSINTALGRMRYALLNLRRMMVSADEENVYVSVPDAVPMMRPVEQQVLR